MTNAIIATVVVLAALVKGVQMLGWLPTDSNTRFYRDKVDVLDEIVRSLRAENVELKQTRSLEPVLLLLTSSAETQAQVIDRLQQMNGSIRAVHEGLERTNEALALVTEGLKFASAAAVTEPVDPKPARRRKPRTGGA